MSLHVRAVLQAPGWLTTVMVIALHAGAIAWMLGRPDPDAPMLVSTPPLVLKLAPPSAPPVPSPPDLAVASAASPLVEPPPAAAAPIRSQPDVLETEHGTLAKNPPKKSPPRERKPQPRPPKKTDPAPSPPQHLASATPPAPIEVVQSAAPPPVNETTKNDESAALVKGAAATALDALDSWEAQVLARLASAKRYPQNARIAREQDTVTVSFTVAPDGKVGAEKILRSAGFQSLEEEALDLVVRVSPLPPPPGGESQRLSLPIEFYLLK